VRRFLRILAALAVAYALLVVLLLPPRPKVSVAVTGPEAASLAAPAVVRGAFHIHTNRSDGTGTIEEVAAAAARAGLDFIVLTDHGDGMRAPFAPAMHGGVLVLDGVEISTSGGHYVALGLPGASPYRLAGEPRDVVEDVRRMGGFGVAAHPDSPKAQLRWNGWDAIADGLEWLNADTEWRDESRLSLLRSLATYPWRPPETVAALVSHHPRPLLSRWDDLARTRRTVGLAAVDAHARIGMRDGPDPYGGRVLAKIPSYEASFRTFALHVELNAPFSGDAARDGAALLDAIRAGHVYTTHDALAAPGAVVGFQASTSSGPHARMGDFLAPDGGPIEWRAAAAAPAGSTLRLICDGKTAAEAPATTVLTYRHHTTVGEDLSKSQAGVLPASCRLEAGWSDGDRRVTWLITNPIYLRPNDPPMTSRDSYDDEAEPSAMPQTWEIERDPMSAASWQRTTQPPLDATDVNRPGTEVEFTYQLRGGERTSQYAALVSKQVASIEKATYLQLVLRAQQPMRLSVQLRTPAGERWVRSIYLPPQRTYQRVWFDEMRPVPPATAAHPPLDKVHAVLFVVDTEHTPPGTWGRLFIEQVRFEGQPIPPPLPALPPPPPRRSPAGRR
jgi:hypothetical protein